MRIIFWIAALIIIAWGIAKHDSSYGFEARWLPAAQHPLSVKVRERQGFCYPGRCLVG